MRLKRSEQPLSRPMSDLLERIRRAGGALEVTRERPRSVLCGTEVGINSGVWRGLQIRGLVRAKRLGKSRFLLTMIQPQNQNQEPEAIADVG